MVFPEQPSAVACYRHEKIKASHHDARPVEDSPRRARIASDDFPSPAWASGSYIDAVRRMAATRTRDTFGTCLSEIAIDPCAAAIGRRRKCARLGGPAMITLSIFWALVLALSTVKGEQPTTSGSKQ